MVYVVGAVAIDMIAVKERFLDGTSNPSDIRMGLGGVGYRIFGNLDAPKRFITALADDPISRWAESALSSDGDVAIQIVGARDAGPPLYLALMESGSLKVAASDFRIVEQALSLDFVERHISDSGPDDFLVLDANLSARLLASLVERYAGRTRVVFEPVSVEKSARHAEALHDLYLLTPTAEELSSLGLLGSADMREFMAARCIAHLLVTQGRDGATLWTGAGETGHGETVPARISSVHFAPARVVEARDTTGAGDLLLAGLLSALQRGQPMEIAVRAAMDGVEARLEKEAS
jgi:sugar/nucleoside kinase (ribokinase family)